MKKPRQFEVVQPLLEEPDSDGWWYYDLTGTVLRVVRKVSGELVFPAGQWSEHEAPVSAASRQRKEWGRAYPIIPVEVTRLHRKAA